METEQIKKILTELLDLAEEFKSVEDLVEKIPPFTAVLLAISRRDYPILHSISLLKDDSMSGDAILDLSRRIFEDMISVEFMIVKGKEEMAAKFIKYALVERWLDLEYLKKLGVNQDANLEKEIEKDYQKVKNEFLFRSTEVARSWSKTTVEKMIDELVAANTIPKDKIVDLLQGYVLGNRKNHLASRDTQIFVDKSQRENEIIHAPRIGMVISIISYIRILSKYFQEVGNEDMVAKLDNLFSKLNVNGNT